MTTTRPRTVDPLGREVLPNERIPFQPWWQILSALGGVAISLVMLVFCVDAWMDNIKVLDGGQRPFINTGLAMVGFLLALALLLGFVAWFRKRGGLSALLVLLAVAVIPPGTYLLSTAL